jgi:hypothetical protein
MRGKIKNPLRCFSVYTERAKRVEVAALFGIFYNYIAVSSCLILYSKWSKINQT